MSKGLRVGLSCYGDVPTGLGQIARRFASRLPFASRLVWPHPKLEPDKSVPTVGECREFLESVDTVLVIERPMPTELFVAAKSMGRRTVCAVMPEWLSPASRWVPYCDLFVCFTKQGYRHCRTKVGVGRKTVYCEYPLDPSEFEFRVREKVERVVFCEGWGGVHERKGRPEVEEMLALDRNCVEVRSQRNPALVHSVAAVPSDLYKDADCVLVPGRFDGLGLTTLEALASGCLVLATNCEPYRQFLLGAYGGLGMDGLFLPVKSQELVSVSGQRWVSSRIDPALALRAVTGLKNTGTPFVSRLSQAGRTYIETTHGANEAWQRFWALVTLGHVPLDRVKGVTDAR